MIFTHLVKESEIEEFCVNDLSKYDKYVFVVTPDQEHYELVIEEMGVLLSSSKYLVFLVGALGVSVFGKNKQLAKIFSYASADAPSIDHSFVCVLDRVDILSGNNVGLYRGLYLSINPDDEDISDILYKTISGLLKENKKINSLKFISPLISLAAKILAGHVGVPRL